MSGKRISPGKTIGIIGGGQLGRMMALAAKPMGYRIAVLDPSADSPCSQVADITFRAAFNDLEAAKELASVSDVITYEFENIDYEVLTWLEKNAHLPQGSELIRITQDRENEKRAITASGGKVAPYKIIRSKNEILPAAAEIGYPSVLKTCRGGYDGKGQVVIRSETDIEAAEQLLGHGTCILEQWLTFQKEISVIVQRSVSGEIKTLPVGENKHVDNILFQTIVPARISAPVEDKAINAAVNLAESMNMVGTLAVEMFLTEDEEIFINELAPRPHNSGHYSMDACETSQFEQHIRAICDWPLGDTNVHTPVIMVNILGEEIYEVVNKIDAFNDCKLHLYGKNEVKAKRKMGHLNVLGENSGEKIENLKIWNR
jgi:5-(carboxyamino)imidazole ribonucleotide synthase